MTGGARGEGKGIAEEVQLNGRWPSHSSLPLALFFTQVRYQLVDKQSRATKIRRRVLLWY